MATVAAFAASLPSIQSAVSVGGDGSVRLKLDVPESELAEILKLIAYGRDKVLQVLVTAGDDD